MLYVTYSMYSTCVDSQWVEMSFEKVLCIYNTISIFLLVLRTWSIGWKVGRKDGTSDFLALEEKKNEPMVEAGVLQGSVRVLLDFFIKYITNPAYSMKKG